MTSKILIAVEDDYFSKQISAFLESHDWPGPVEFQVLHVVSPYPGVKPLQTARELQELSWEIGGKLVNHASKLIRNAVPKATVTERLLEGDPREVIVDEARSWQADMIVVGAHGQNKRPLYPLGSVSSVIAAYAPCSVLIVRKGKSGGK